MWSRQQPCFSKHYSETSPVISEYHPREVESSFVPFKRGGYSLSLDVVYRASLVPLTEAEFVLSGSVTDDDGALHRVAFRHARFSR